MLNSVALVAETLLGTRKNLSMESGPHGARQHKPGVRHQSLLCTELEKHGGRSLTRVLAVLGIITMLVTTLALYHSGGVEGDVTVVSMPGTGQVGGAERGHMADRGTNASWLAGKERLVAVRKGFNSVIVTGERLKDKLKRHMNFQHCDWDQNLEGLWNGMDLFKYPDGSKIPAQAWRHCKTLFLAASSTTGKGIVVEFGSWIGQSSRCLGAGINTTGYKEHLFSYDSYNNPINHNKFMGSKYENDEIKDFQFIWYETVLPVYPSARSVKGKIDKEHFDADLWPKKMIEVFAIDSAKTHKNFMNQAGLVWQYLAIGSVLCMMDFAKTPQVELFYSEFVTNGSLELVSLDFCASPWTFIVKKPLDWSLVMNFNPWNRSEEQWHEIFNSINKDIDRIAHQYKMTRESQINCLKQLVKKRRDLVLSWTRNPNANWDRGNGGGNGGAYWHSVQATIFEHD